MYNLRQGNKALPYFFMSEEKPNYLTSTKLKERGFTEGKIKKFLGDADLLVTNPAYRTGPPMRLFLEKRVEEVEKSQEFQDWLSKSKSTREKQSQIQLKIAENKRQELRDYITNLDIEIELIPSDKLFQKAQRHYNNLWSDRGDDDKFCHESTVSDSNKKFLHRITVNMLRHEFTNYENELCDIFGKIGVAEGYLMLKTKVLNKIAEVYPFLKNECERQKTEMINL